MRHSEFDIHKVGERLSGQCMESLDEVISDLYPGMTEDDMLPGDYDELDNICFLCPVCGWWCEISERAEEPNDSGEDVCEDCKEEE